MTLWGKLIKDNRLLRDRTVSDDSSDTRTHKIFRALEELCRGWDIPVPIWLDSAVADFRRMKKVRFYQDSFVGEEIFFDYLEFQVLEE